MPDTDPSQLASLHPRLRSLLDAELAAGNEIVDIGPGLPGPGGMTVRLRKPFTRALSLPRDGVTLREVNDPHWWKSEFAAGNDLLTCGF